jgi:hypothetical protein
MLHIFCAVALHIQVLFPNCCTKVFFYALHGSAVYCNHEQGADIIKTYAAYCALVNGSKCVSLFIFSV